MRSRRLFTRLFWSMVGVGVLTALVVTLLYDRSFGRGLRKSLWRELREQAVVLEALARDTLAGTAPPSRAGVGAKPGIGAELGVGAGLQARLMRLGAINGTRYTVIDASGNVLAESAREPRQFESHSDRTEVVAALRDGEGTVQRYSTTVGVELAYLARAVRGADGSLLGIARVARPSEAVDSSIGANRQELLFAAVVALLTAGTMAWLLARGIARPVGHLRAVAHAMAEGEDGTRATLTTDDEFGALSQALNAMAVRLQERVEEMRRERAKMSAIIGSMVEGVAAVDADERVLHLNAAAADMFGVHGEDTVGRPLLEVMRIAEISDMVTAILTRGGKASRELTIHKGSEGRVIQLEAAPLRDRTGGVDGAVLVLHDITDLRRLEAMRRDFVANVSHELKTPLTAIKGMVDTMVDDRQMPEDVRERFLGKIKRQADRLANLVTDLLVLARIESSKSGDDLLPLDLSHPVRESSLQLMATAQEKQLQLRLVLPDAPVIVNGESESLRQVVDNLLGNAIRYTPERGEVSVTVAARNGEAVLTVRDTGIGIEARHVDRIFERFYRVDKARSRELGGTGLGLAIVKHVVLSHGGTVSVQSRLGFGSSFRVRIPLARPASDPRLVS